MNSFNIHLEPHETDKYYISVNIVIYRAKFGKYPDFLSEYEHDSKDGYATKFSYLLSEKATMLTEREALLLIDAFESKYGPVLQECENTYNWDKSPFDFSKMTLLYSK